MAVKAGIQPREVDYKELQDNLKTQGVYIPETVGVPGKTKKSSETLNVGDRYMRDV